MKAENKKSILEKYKIALQKGELFWPDSIYKDLIVSLAIFILLIMLATFIGVPGEPKADPSDTSYVPRPEWYFLFLFKFLALYGQIPVVGKIEWIATTIIPILAIGVLFVLPLIDRNPARAYSRRILALTVMGVFLVSVVTLTLIANIPTTTLPLLQFLGGLAVPGLAFVILFGLSFLAGKAVRQVGNAQVWVAGIAALAMVGLTLAVMAFAPPAAASESKGAGTLAEQIAQGQDLYSLNCVECHGADGEGGVIQGVAALEGFKMKAIHSQDEMYTRDDQTLADILNYGQPNLGMQPFGKAYGGTLSPTEIDSLVAFLRYTWDDRAQMPAGAISSIPVLGSNEVPSWDVHIQLLTKRYCLSCHQAGKQNNNYLVDTYDDMLKTGDNAPVMTAGDANSLLIQLINGHASQDPKTGNTIRQMPPTKLLDQQYIEMLTRWILYGMPRTAQEAANKKANFPSQPALTSTLTYVNATYTPPQVLTQTVQNPTISVSGQNITITASPTSTSHIETSTPTVEARAPYICSGLADQEAFDCFINLLNSSGVKGKVSGLLLGDMVKPDLYVVSEPTDVRYFVITSKGDMYISPTPEVLSNLRSSDPNVMIVQFKTRGPGGMVFAVTLSTLFSSDYGANTLYNSGIRTIWSYPKRPANNNPYNDLYFYRDGPISELHIDTRFLPQNYNEFLDGEYISIPWSQ